MNKMRPEPALDFECCGSMSAICVSDNEQARAVPKFRRFFSVVAHAPGALIGALAVLQWVRLPPTPMCSCPTSVGHAQSLVDNERTHLREGWYID